MRRTVPERRVRSQPESVTGDDGDVSDVETSEAGSVGGRSNATGGSKRHLTIAEREAAYNEARSRIFMGFEGKDKDKEYVRARRRGTRPEGEPAPAPAEGSEPKAPRLPKRPVALLIGFCGDGYNGMQMCVLRFQHLRPLNVICERGLRRNRTVQPARSQCAHHRGRVV